MANSNSIAIQITADSVNAVSNINKVGTSLSGLGSQTNTIVSGMVARWLSFAGVAASILSVVNAVKKYADMGEELLKTSQMIGISVEHLSGLKYAADLSETSIESLTTGVGLLSRKLIDAAGGSQEAQRVFNTLKINFLNRDTYDVLLEIADSFAKMRDGAAKTAYAMELFGRSGKDLIPLMNEGSAGIKRMYEAAEKAGVIMSTQAAKAADEFNDNITKLKTNIQGLTFPILSDLISKLNHFYETISKKGVISGLESQFRQQQFQDMIDGIDRGINNYLNMMKDSATKGDIWWRKLLGMDLSREEIQKKLEDLYKFRDSLVRKYNEEFGVPATTPVTPALKETPAFIDAAALEKAKKAWEANIQERVKYDNFMLAEAEKYNKEQEKLWEENIKARVQYDEYMLAEVKRYEEEQAKIQREANELFKQETEFRMQMYEDSWQKMFDMANQIGGEAGQGIGQMMAGMKGITDIETGQDPYSQRLDQLQQFIWDAYALHEEGAMSELQLDNFVSQQMAEMDNTLMEQKLGIAQNTFGTMAGLMRTLSTISKTEGDKAFKSYQAFAMGEAMISTALAILKVFSGEGNIYSKIVQAALMAALCAVQVSNIASARPGGGTAMSAPSGGGGYGYTSPEAPSWQAEEQPKSQIINVHYYHYGHVVDHDSFSREIVPSLKKAVQDGVE